MDLSLQKLSERQKAASEEADFDPWVGTLQESCGRVTRSWAHIDYLARRYYDTIWVKWKAMGQVQRIEVLRDAAILHGKIGMAKNHRPDIEGIEPVPGYEDVDVYVTQSCFMWPHLTEEDLSFGDTLLTYFYYRATTHFLDHIHADLQSTRAGIGKPTFTPYIKGGMPQPKPRKAKRHLVSFRRNDEQAIGPLLLRARIHTQPKGFYFELHGDPTQQGPVAEDLLDKFSFDNALRVMLVQRRIYDYLFHVCSIILQGKLQEHEFENAEKKPGKLRKEAMQARQSVFARRYLAPAFLSTQRQGNNTMPPDQRPGRHGRNNAVPALSDLRIQAIYGQPSKINWVMLGELIDERVYSATSNLTLLRENPSIFEDAIRHERIDIHPRMNVELSPAEDEFNKSEFDTWRDAFKGRIGTAMRDYEHWLDLRHEFIVLRNTFAHVKLRLNNHEWTAYQELNCALYSFHYRAQVYSESLITQLEDFVRTSWFFHDYIERKQFNDLAPTAKLDSIGEAHRKRVYKKMLRLLANDRKRYGLSPLLDNLERELESTFNDGQSGARYLPEYVLRILSDLGVFAECLNQVESFQPHATLLLSSWSWRSLGTVRKEVDDREKTLKEITSSNKPWNVLTISALPKPGRFDYPCYAERTEQNVKQLRNAEDHLDDFWDKFLEELGPGPRNLNPFPRKSLELIRERPTRTPEWDEESAKFLEAQESNVGETKTEVPVKSLHDEMTERQQQREALKKDENARPKTPSPKRARADDEEPINTSPWKKYKRANPFQPTSSAAEPPLRPKIPVSSETLDAIGYLFHVPGQNVEGQLSWTEFCKAMYDIGFEQKWSLGGGSKTHWKPVGEALLRSLPTHGRWRGHHTIDKPHPPSLANNIPNEWTRKWGGYLRDRYEWTIDSFEERT